MRIAVKQNCQRQGIGRKLIEDLIVNYPCHLSLDVSTDNLRAIGFYKKVGLSVTNTYITPEQKVEFVTFRTPEGFVYTDPYKKQGVCKSISLPEASPAKIEILPNTSNCEEPRTKITESHVTPLKLK